MDKKYLIAGGVGVVAIGGFMFLRAKNRAAVVAANSEGQAAGMQSTGSLPSFESSTFSSLLPVSGGSSSINSPSDPTNSGSTASGGGFDFSSLFGDLIKNNATQQSAQTTADSITSDSAILASIIGSNKGGTISHDASGATTIGINKGSAVDEIIAQQYKELLGRDVDTSGQAFWSNNLVNNSGFGIADLIVGIKGSDEYKAKQAAAAKPASTVAPTTTPAK